MTDMTLYNYSTNYENRVFDDRSLNKPIKELTLEDINWCLKNRLYLHQVLDLFTDKIETNWEKIDQHYPTKICQWYDEAIREILTIPYAIWDSRTENFDKICNYVKASNKRLLKIESKIVELFLNHKPKPKSWTNEDSKNFLENISYATSLDLAGNLIEAFKQIRELKYALMYGQSVFIEPTFKTIFTEDELFNFIREEYTELGEDIIENHLILGLKQEKLIIVANTK